MNKVIYDSEYHCTYNDNCNEDCDEHYRRDFLSVLKLKEWDGKVINQRCESLWSILNKDLLFRQLVMKSPFYNEEDLLTSFMGMFNYDQLWWMHICVCEILKIGKLSDVTFNKMKANKE